MSLTVSPGDAEDQYRDHDVVVLGGNPGLVDKYEWAYWGRPDLTIAEKVAHMNTLS